MSEEKKLNGTVIVTYRCNARCSMCNRYKAPSKPEEEISIETIKKLPKMYFTNITGGEPFIRTDLKDIVRELYKKSDRIVISTNGFFTDRIVDLCKEFPQIGIRISIEGLEQTNNEIRGLQDGYAKGYGTLKILREMGMKDVGFGMTVQDKNAPDLVPLYKISDEMGIGYWLCPATMQGGDIQGAANLIGLFLVKAGAALIDHMAILFAVGVGVGMSEKNDGTGGIAALASWLMMTTLLSTGFVTTIMPSIAESATKTLAFDKIENPFIGILAGVIGSMCYNKFKDTKLPDWLSFFSGKRCVAIIAGVVSIIVSAVLLFIWPLLFGALVSLGKAIVGMDVVGAGIYAFLNRLLIPTGLHHALNNVFWFDTIGLGDLQHFWAGETSADVTWSLGMYMSGFFPCMMFGIPGAALAMIKCAKPEKKKLAIGLIASAALCSFICGVIL